MRSAGEGVGGIMGILPCILRGGMLQYIEGALIVAVLVDVVHEGELDPPSEEGLEGLLRSRGASESKS